MKYEFVLNGKVYSLDELNAFELAGYLTEMIIDLDRNVLVDLLAGKPIQLDDFSGDNTADILILKPVK